MKRLEDMAKNINENNAKVIMKLSETYKEQIESLKRSLGASTGKSTPGDVAIKSIDRRYDTMEKTLDKLTTVADNYMKYKMKVPEGYKLDDEHNDSEYRDLQNEIATTSVDETLSQDTINSNSTNNNIN